MIALVLAASIQVATYVPPPQEQIDEGARLIVDYFTAVARKARLLGACSAYAPAGAMDDLLNQVLDEPHLAPVVEDFRPVLTGQMHEAHARGQIEARTESRSAADCATVLREADEAIASKTDGFRRTWEMMENGVSPAAAEPSR